MEEEHYNLSSIVKHIDSIRSISYIISALIVYLIVDKIFTSLSIVSDWNGFISNSFVIILYVLMTGGFIILATEFVVYPILKNNEFCKRYRLGVIPLIFLIILILFHQKYNLIDPVFQNESIILSFFKSG